MKKVRLPRNTFVTDSGELFTGKRLLTLDQSKAVVIPAQWAKIFAPNGWVEVLLNHQTSELVIRPLTEEKWSVIHGHRSDP